VSTAVWCEHCQQSVDEESLTDEVACPECGTVLREERRPVPWHFKLMLVATVVYLGYRAYQGVGWVVHHV
jgi:DNA-directed RNA polymerase subunit RPC12/RpoP